MSHYVNINGTAHEITGGKVNVDGTAYDIVKGKTLIDETEYDILFKPETLTVTLKHSSSHCAGSIQINGVSYYDQYNQTVQVLEVPYGTSMFALCNYNTYGTNGLYYNDQKIENDQITINIVRNTVITFSSYWWEGSWGNEYASYVYISD